MTTIITVPGNSFAWTPSGVSARAGDILRVFATGAVAPISGSSNEYPPYGDTGRVAGVYPRYPADVSGFAASAVALFGLAIAVSAVEPVAQVHDAVMPFRVGTTTDGEVYFVAASTGQIWLNFNDTYYGDNAGSYVATITTGIALPATPILAATGLLVANTSLIRLGLS